MPFNPGGISTRIIHRDLNVPKTRYAAFSFDVRGLEDVPRARFRFYLNKDGNSVLPTAMRTLRVSAAVTAPWESDQLCWDKPILELDTTSISGEIGRIVYSGTTRHDHACAVRGVMCETLLLQEGFALQLSYRRKVWYNTRHES